MRIESQKEINWLLRDKYCGEKSTNFWYDVSRLKKGEPVDYVIGWTPFLGCKIDLSLRPFIPRPETEYWVKNAIAEIKSIYGNKPLRILDIFAGSGCIGVAALKHLPNSQVDFIDNDATALQQIKINFTENGIDSSRARIIRSDVFENVDGCYDAILANPPYVPISRKNLVAHSVLEHEPHRAVFGGRDGLDTIRRFLYKARQHLNSNGIIWIEFDSPEKDKINQIVEKSGYSGYEFLRDQFGEWRTLKIVV